MREKTPQTPACLHASPKASVSGPGMVVAVAIISSLSYMMPWVEYSGKMIRSMPGRPYFVPFTTSQILRTLAITCVHGARGRASAQETVLSRRLSRARPITLLMRVEARHLVLEDASPDRVWAGRDVSVARHERCEAISDKKSPAPQMYPASQVLLARSTVENGERETS